MTLSIVSYAVAFIIYRPQLMQITGVFEGERLLEAGFIGFALVWIWWIMTSMQSIRLRTLFGVFLAWFLMISTQAFYSVPSFTVLLVIGVLLELVAVILWLLPEKRLG